MIADDQPLFRHAISEAIRSRRELELLAAASNGQEALGLIRDLGPDVGVLDVSLSDLDGLAVLEAATRERLPARILFVADTTDAQLVHDCLARGASGFIDKRVGVQEICDAVGAAARGHTVVTEHLENGVVERIRLDGQRELRPSPRELEVLRLLVDGLTGPQIARRLHVETATIKAHMHNLYEKLHVSDRAAAVAEGMRRGLIE